MTSQGQQILREPITASPDVTAIARERRLMLQRKAGARHRAKHPDRTRHRHLVNTFNIGIDQFNAMVAAQGGNCAICGKPEVVRRSGKTKALAVDHCHASGRIRALLCHKCNTGLGSFSDRPDLLLAAADYLRSHFTQSSRPSSPLPVPAPSDSGLAEKMETAKAGW